MNICGHERRSCHLDGITYGNWVIHTRLGCSLSPGQMLWAIACKATPGFCAAGNWRQKWRSRLYHYADFSSPPVSCPAPHPCPLLCLVPLSSMLFVLIILEISSCFLRKWENITRYQMKLQGPGHTAAPATEFQSIPVFSLSTHSSFSGIPDASNPRALPGFPKADCPLTTPPPLSWKVSYHPPSTFHPTCSGPGS